MWVFIVLTCILTYCYVCDFMQYLMCSTHSTTVWLLRTLALVHIIRYAHWMCVYTGGIHNTYFHFSMPFNCYKIISQCVKVKDTLQFRFILQTWLQKVYLETDDDHGPSRYVAKRERSHPTRTRQDATLTATSKSQAWCHYSQSTHSSVLTSHRHKVCESVSFWEIMFPDVKNVTIIAYNNIHGNT